MSEKRDFNLFFLDFSGSVKITKGSITPFQKK